MIYLMDGFLFSRDTGLLEMQEKKREWVLILIEKIIQYLEFNIS